MLKILAYASAFCAICAIAPLGASATPLGLVKNVAIENGIVQVRDGCGPGLRFSNRRQTCVEDFDRGPQPQYYEDRGDRGYRDQGYRGRDYRDDNDAAAAAAAAGAIIGGVIGGAQRDGDDRRRRYQ